MYRCEICGAVFDRPLVNEYYEPRPDCFYERFKQLLCPVCGQGKVIKGHTAYGCSRWREGCDFRKPFKKG